MQKQQQKQLLQRIEATPPDKLDDLIKELVAGFT
jgi:hypothetical protein